MIGKFFTAALLLAGGTMLSAADELKIDGLPEGGRVSVLEAKSKSRTADDKYVLENVPESLKGLQMVSVPRGEIGKPAPEYTFTIDKPAMVFILVHNRGKVTLSEEWTREPGAVLWLAPGRNMDAIYAKHFPAGTVTVPGHDGKDGGSYGLPNAAVVQPDFAAEGKIGVAKLPPRARISKLEVGNKMRISGGDFIITGVPDALKDLQMVSVLRGKGAEPGAAYTFTVDQPTTVYLLVQARGEVTLPEGWSRLNGAAVQWQLGSMKLADMIYQKDFPAGVVEIPAHNGKDASGVYGVPNAAVLQPTK